MIKLGDLKPAAPKTWLQLLAGVIWSAVGAYLILLAWGWIFVLPLSRAWFYWLPGLALASLIYKFGFSKLAQKNSRRIKHLPVEKPCLFAFQEWHSYPLVLLMVAMGIGLRVYSPLPKPLLGVLYLGIGGGLSSASLHYYWQIIRTRKHRQDRIN
jgi:hypothetical protein